MTPASASLVSADRNAPSVAWLCVAVLTLMLVPVPAILVSLRAGLVGGGFAGIAAVARTLVAATPVCAAPPFLMGSGLGAFFHCVSTAPERFAEIEANRPAPLGVRSLIASSIFVGCVLAAAGLVLATTVLPLG